MEFSLYGCFSEERFFLLSIIGLNCTGICQGCLFRGQQAPRVALNDCWTRLLLPLPLGKKVDCVVVLSPSYVHMHNAFHASLPPLLLRRTRSFYRVTMVVREYVSLAFFLKLLNLTQLICHLCPILPSPSTIG